MTLGSALPFGGCMGRLNSPSAVAIASDEITEMQSKLMVALLSKKEEYRTKFKQEMSFTRVLLKLGTVRTFMNDIRRVFHERDTDQSGRIDMCEMSTAMKDLKVNLSEDEIKALFKMADFYEDKQLTMKQFLVVLAMGYVLDAIPDLMEKPANAEAEAAARAAGRRMSNFYNKEQTVRNALELFTYAYLLFDKECKGVISREQVMIVVAENGQKDEGSMSILSQERWDEMDWDSNGDISFGEFVYAFTKWVDVDGEDTADELAMEAEAAAAAELKREGGQARRKSSVSVARKTSVMAKEITRRISSALLPQIDSAADPGGSNSDDACDPAGSSPKDAAGGSAVAAYAGPPVKPAMSPSAMASGQQSHAANKSVGFAGGFEKAEEEESMKGGAGA